MRLTIIIRLSGYAALVAFPLAWPSQSNADDFETDLRAIEDAAKRARYSPPPSPPPRSNNRGSGGSSRSGGCPPICKSWSGGGSSWESDYDARIKAAEAERERIRRALERARESKANYESIAVWESHLFRLESLLAPFSDPARKDQVDMNQWSERWRFLELSLKNERVQLSKGSQGTIDAIAQAKALRKRTHLAPLTPMEYTAGGSLVPQRRSSTPPTREEAAAGGPGLPHKPERLDGAEGRAGSVAGADGTRGSKPGLASQPGPSAKGAGSKAPNDDTTAGAGAAGPKSPKAADSESPTGKKAGPDGNFGVGAEKEEKWEKAAVMAGNCFDGLKRTDSSCTKPAITRIPPRVVPAPGAKTDPGKGTDDGTGFGGTGSNDKKYEEADGQAKSGAKVDNNRNKKPKSKPSQGSVVIADQPTAPSPPPVVARGFPPVRPDLPAPPPAQPPVLPKFDPPVADKKDEPKKKEPELSIPENDKVEKAVRVTRGETPGAGSAGGSASGGTSSGGAEGGRVGWPFDKSKGGEPAGEPVKPPSAPLLEQAFALLDKSDTGRSLLALAAREKIDFKMTKKLVGGPVLFDPESRKLLYNLKRIEGREGWNATELAGIVAHELQHAAQDLDGLKPGRKKLEYEAHAVAQIVLAEVFEKEQSAPPARLWFTEEIDAWHKDPQDLEELLRGRYAEAPAKPELSEHHQEHLTRPAQECRANKKPSRPIQCFFSLEELSAIDHRYDDFTKAVAERRKKKGKGAR